MTLSIVPSNPALPGERGEGPTLADVAARIAGKAGGAPPELPEEEAVMIVPGAGEAEAAEAAAGMGEDGAEAAALAALGDGDLDRLVRVRVAGREVEIPLREALAGYSRESDYRQKTQGLAQERRGHQAAVQQVAAERAHLAGLVSAIERQLIGSLPKEEQLAELRQTDPNQYLLTMEDIRSRLGWLQGLKAQAVAAQRRSAVEAAQQAQAARARAQTAAREQLFAELPELQEASVRETLGRGLREALTEVGYTERDIAGIADPRVVKFIHRALKDRTDADAYRKLQARGPQTEQRVADAPRVARPGTAATPQAVAETRVKDLRNKAARSGRVDDIAALIAAKNMRR